MEELDKEIGLKLKKLRERLSLSLREVDQRTGIDFSYIGKIEKGKMPSMAKLKQLCDFYGITVQSLFGEEVETPDQLKEVGVEWITFAKNMKEKQLTPEEIEKMVAVVKALKNL